MSERAESKHFPTTTSVALRLGWQPKDDRLFPRLVLVTKKGTGQLGLIAGGIEKDEDPFKAAYREAEEEADLPPYFFVILNSRPQVLVSPQSAKSSVGLVYDAELCEPIPLEGYDPKSPEISWVKPYTAEELLPLVRDPKLWYRPEFNLPPVKGWLREYAYYKYGSWEGDRFAHQVLLAWELI